MAHPIGCGTRADPVAWHELAAEESGTVAGACATLGGVVRLQVTLRVRIEQQMADAIDAQVKLVRWKDRSEVVRELLEEALIARARKRS